jgi:hypothetical protein
MNEIEYGARIQADSFDEAIMILETMVQEGAIDDFRAGDDYIEFIRTENDEISAGYAALPRYSSDLDEQKGLNITRAFKYNKMFNQSNFSGIGYTFDQLADLKDEIEQATSFDVNLYIDKVVYR